MDFWRTVAADAKTDMMIIDELGDGFRKQGAIGDNCQLDTLLIKGGVVFNVSGRFPYTIESHQWLPTKEADVNFFIVAVGRHADGFETVHNRRGDIGGVVGCGNEYDFGKIKGVVDVVVDKTLILSRI